MRLVAALLAAVALTGCAGGSAREKPHLAAHDALSAIQAAHAPIRNGHSGAPMNGIVVSGTITNTGTATMHCVPSSFLLVDASGNATMPAAQWCDVPSIDPSHSAGFNAAFPAGASGRLQLRYVHPDGSYEVHELPLPPA